MRTGLSLKLRSGVNAPFTLAPDRIEARLRARLTPAELGALLFAAGLALAFAYIDATYKIGAFPDYRTFIKTADGIFGSASGGFFYAHWSRPVFSLLNLLPLAAGYVLWCWLNIAGIWFAARVFGGHLALALVSYQMLYVLYYGNIVGVIVGGLALLWWGLHRDWWLLAGLGWALACTKLQAGIPFGLALILLAEVTWLTRLRVGLVVLVVALLSLVIYPGWLQTLYETTRQIPPDTRGNIALWQYVGALSLILWLPLIALWRRLNTGQRLAGIAALIALTSPYFQQTDLLLLFVLPVGSLALAGNLGYLFLIFTWSALKLLGIVPVLLYVRVMNQVRQRPRAAS